MKIIKESDWVDNNPTVNIMKATEKAIKSGWRISRQRILYKPGDASSKWSARFVLVEHGGRYIYVPTWLPQIMGE